MKFYARIDEGRVAEIVQLPDDLDPADAMHPSIKLVALEGGAQPPIGHVYNEDGTFSEPPPRVLTQSEIITRAANALQVSDYVAMRCIKGGIKYPKAWTAYDEALRAIVRGESVVEALPEAPPKPEY